jgi:hypothetical protein
MRGHRRGLEAHARQQPEHPALPAPLLRRPDREVGEDPEGPVTPAVERPGGDPQRCASVAQHDVAQEEGREIVKGLGHRTCLRAAQPADSCLPAHGRRSGIGGGAGEALGESVGHVGLPRGADYDECAVGSWGSVRGDAIPQLAVQHIVRRMQPHPRRIARARGAVDLRGGITAPRAGRGTWAMGVMEGGARRPLAIVGSSSENPLHTGTPSKPRSKVMMGLRLLAP